MKKRLVGGLTIAWFLFFYACTATAITFDFFSDETSFLAAAGSGLNFVDFEGLGNNTYRTYDSGNGVVFSSSNSSVKALLVAPAGLHQDIITDSLFGKNPNSTLSADFSMPVHAIGSDVISWPSDSDLSVVVRDEFGTISNYTVSANHGYFGIISHGSRIMNITYSPGSKKVGVDNFYFVNSEPAPEPTPEPATILLFGTGIVGLIGWRLRRK